ncbi:MAG: hypothetical protein ABIJ61_00595 [bacterium]
MKIRDLLSRVPGPQRSMIAALKPRSSKKNPITRSARPRLKSFTIGDNSLADPSSQTYRTRLQLYRFLRDNIPLLSSVVWTWVRLCAGRYEYRLVNDPGSATEQRVTAVLDQLDRRLFRNGLMKRAGFNELLLQFFESLFTDGAVCGELQLAPSGKGIDRFLLADMRSIEIEPSRGGVKLYQIGEEKRTRLNDHTIFFYGLNANPSNPAGRSLLQAIPFVARVEQTLVSDMHRSMRNAGYQRIHVKITPPERRSDESEDDYFDRANSYFDDTVTMMQDFGPDKNPVTWEDVKIEYIGPSAKISSSNAWYLNHKAMIEDVCAGTHLAPFMLGYAYGTTHNWAEFKYDLVLRQVETVQNAATALLDWLANVELALAGVDAEVRFAFKNRLIMGRGDRASAEKVHLENVITKMEKGFITKERALRELEQF